MVVWWWFDGALFGARYWWIVSSLELTVSVDVHVHADGVGETSLTLIDVVNVGSLIRRVWMWTWRWYPDDYLACWWTKWTMKCWDIIAERRGTVWSSYREPRMMWIFDVIWEFRCDRMLWFQRFISYLLYLFIVLRSFISLCCKYCYYLFNSFNKNIHKT